MIYRQEFVYKLEQIGGYVNYIVLYHEIVRKFFNYSGTFFGLATLAELSAPNTQPVGGDRRRSAEQTCSAAILKLARIRWYPGVILAHTLRHASKIVLSLKSREVKIPIEIEIDSTRRLSFFFSDYTLSFCHIWGLLMLSHA